MKLASLSLVLFSLATASAAHAAGALEIVPSLGLGKPTGDGSDDYDVGVAVGLAVGGRLHPNFSLGGQVSYDGLSPDVPGASAAGVDVSGYMLRVRAVPAFHFANDKLDFSIGPTLGMFFFNVSAEAAGQEATFTARGLEVGFLTSLLFEVHPSVALGPYFSWSRLIASKTCQEETGSSKVCNNDSDSEDAGFWSLGVAAKF